MGALARVRNELGARLRNCIFPKELSLPDRFHGKRRLPTTEQGARNRDQPHDAGHRRRGRIASHSSAVRRTWIETVGAVDAATPMWASRRSWLAQVAYWADSESGQAACSQQHIRAEVVVRVTIAMAEYADGATGRNCAASNRSVAAAAGCSESVVTRIRNKLLAPAGFALEARRGSGGAGRKNRASVWHLIPNATLPCAPVSDLPTLPPGGGLTHLGYPSPRARTRAEKSTRKRGSGRHAALPRPLTVQKLAAGLIARCLGLETVHPGQVCDALTRSGLNLAFWDARQLAAALEADMRQRGINWPDRITRPGAFLAARLRWLPARPPLGDQTPTPPRKESTSKTVTPSTPAARRAALAQMRADVAAATALWRPRLLAL